MPPVRRIGDVDVALVEELAALETIDRHISGRNPLLVAFCNTHTVNIAARNQDFAAALREALVLNDGVGVDIASHLLYGERFPANLNGTDLTPRILGRVRRARIFLLGSRAGVAESACAALAANYSHLEFVGSHHGFFEPNEEESIIARIIALEIDLLLVGMGHPTQELFAARNYRRIAGVTMCIGAFLDFSAGVVSRAPQWMRQARAEWLYRLAIEPRRMARRYITGNASFLLRMIAIRNTMRKGPPN